MLCGLCAPRGLALFYWNKIKRGEKAKKSKGEGLRPFIKWPTRLQARQPEVQKLSELLDVSPADVC